MSRLNKIILIGNVSSQPETKTANSGDTVCSFSLEVERPAAENAPAQSDTFTIVSWRDIANTASALTEGQQLLVEGGIRNRNYETNEGQRVYVTEVEARILKPLGGMVPNTAAQPTSDQVPVIEEAPKEATANFDFNEAIKETPKEAAFATELGKDVPF